jgi:xanthine dehydrogenase small subunit
VPTALLQRSKALRGLAFRAPVPEIAALPQGRVAAQARFFLPAGARGSNLRSHQDRRPGFYVASRPGSHGQMVTRRVSHMDVRFLLNGETVQIGQVGPTDTLLDWLRDRRGLTGTKEGCNEGDCGACTVMVRDADGARALNACILFLPQIDGKAITTVEGIAGPDGTLHPVQKEMIDHHGSQCGFCTPGFVVSMAAAHLNSARDHDDQLAGNLCRCTGYVPIVRAAEAAAEAPVPDWMARSPETPAPAGDRLTPESADALAALYLDHPDATLVAGATDVGLWVTKDMRDIAPAIFLNRCVDLKSVEVTDEGLRIGAMVDMNRMRALMQERHPSYAELIRRYGSVQVRNAATLGGNIANGSPIGDNPPPLIALGATLHLRQGDARRDVPLEAFFLDYGRQDRRASEFVEAITIPNQPDRLRCYKLSKRFDQDISAVCGAFNIAVEDSIVAEACIAFGGMAGIPKRAFNVEAALVGRPWTLETAEAAQEAIGEDFTPLTDMRASSAYRLETAANMIVRCFHELSGARVSVLEVEA